MRTWTVGWMLLLLAMKLSAQGDGHVYRIAPGEAWAAPLVGLFAGAGWYAQSQVEPFTLPELAALDRSTIPAFDRWNAGTWRPGVSRATDVLVGATCLSPFALFASKRPRTEFGRIALMGAEASLTSFGLVNTAKGIAQRTRPFAYGSTAPLDELTSPHARLSFFSGHTCFAATASFFAAKVFADMHPESKLRPMIWASAATIPAAVATMRILAGKHFITDVITGYAVGAAVGILVPALHKTKAGKRLSLGPMYLQGGGGLQAQMRF